MEINALLSGGTIEGSLMNLERSSVEKLLEMEENSTEDLAEISQAGKFMSFLSGLSEDEKAEMESFHEEMREAVESGSFDASEMAEKAPEALKTFAEENGIDLEKMLSDMASKASEMKEGLAQMGPPPPPPPPSTGSDTGSDEDEEMSLTDQLLAAILDEENDVQDTDSISVLL